LAIAAEYEAIQLYMQLAESIDSGKAKVVLKDIADEERACRAIPQASRETRSR